MRPRAKRIALAAGCLLAVASLTAQAPRRPADTGPPWQALFNGKDLSGWTIVGKEKWTVDNGSIYGESLTPKGDGFLKTDKTYKDFHVFLRYKCETNTNSGLFYHSDIQEDISKIRFIQVEIDNSIGNHTGGLHGDRGVDGRSKGWIVWPPAENETVIRPFDWNEMLVMVEGNRIRTRVNGIPMIDFTFPNPNNTDGIIALQIHPGGNAKIRFKDIWIRDFTVRP